MTDADTPEPTVSCQSQKDESRSELASLSVIAVPSERSLLGLRGEGFMYITFFIKHSMSCTSESHLDPHIINTENSQN